MTKQQHFETTDHFFAFNQFGVSLAKRGEEEETLTTLSYAEMVNISRHILAHEEEFLSRQTVLDHRFAELSKTLIELFTIEDENDEKAWGTVGYRPKGLQNFDGLLRIAYRRLQGQEKGKVQHWCQENEQEEVTFWQAFNVFFYRVYRDDLIEKVTSKVKED